MWYFRFTVIIRTCTVAEFVLLCVYDRPTIVIIHLWQAHFKPSCVSGAAIHLSDRLSQFRCSRKCVSIHRRFPRTAEIHWLGRLNDMNSVFDFGINAWEYVI